MRGFARVIENAGNVRTALVLLAVYLYARVQPNSGYLEDSNGPGPHPTGKRHAIREWIARTTGMRQTVHLRMRDGSDVDSRIVDAGALLSVHVDKDYERPGMEWANARFIIDIGAHIGSFTLWAARRATSARVLAIEPNPDTFRLLENNIRRNGLEDRVKPVNAAVGAQVGRAYLDFVAHPLGTRVSEGYGDGVEVSVLSLQGVLVGSGFGHIDLVKIDCEGLEYEILGGVSVDALRRVQTLVCEYHPKRKHQPDELDAILRSAGFIVRRPDSALGILWATRS